MAIANNDKFDLKTVHDKFQEALHEEDDIKLQFYLESYEELDKFFILMGSVFGFVSMDLRTKMDTLKEYINHPDTSEKFATVKSMIDYEKGNGLLNKPGYLSGSRTLLRLHRGLDFIRLFLQKLGELKDEDSTSASCRHAYDQTLAKHHSFVIKNGAKIAMYTLPSRELLLKRVCGEGDNVKRALELLPGTLDATVVVYDRIQHIYTQYELHTLP